jgi:hypothetical protein
MSSTEKDKALIRDLARRVAEIAADPIHDVRREMWKRLNRLERVRPLVQIQAIDWNIWEELIPHDRIKLTDPFLRMEELELRKRIYAWENLYDDRVTEDVITCEIAIEGDIVKTGWGVSSDLEMPEDPSGAYGVHPVIHEEKDLDKIETAPKVSVDWEKTNRRYEQLCELYDGILRVEKRGPDFFWFCPMDWFIQWRGIEQMYVDLLERPAWIHDALERITTGYLSYMEQLERLKVLSPGNGNTRLGSGGYAWTDELPQPDANADHVRLKDLWARASTQIFTEGVSSEMHYEFAIQYENRVLERFGLSCYGCCEPLDMKVHEIRKIGNLRRVSMSPWVNIERGAEAIGKDFVFTHKPNPTTVSMHTWDLELARKELGEALRKTRDNHVEVVLQDLHTLHGEPHRLNEWTQMAQELVQDYA